MSTEKTKGESRHINPLLRIEHVAELLGCSTRHVRNMHREGKMPPRVTISERVIGWRERDIEAWLSSNREEGTDV